MARCEGQIVGFVTGFRPPAEPDTLFIWQIAVDDVYRGRGIALAMLGSLLDRGRQFRWLKTTISPSNTASAALFTALADQRLTALSRTSMFSTADFPESHEREELYVLGPFE